MSDRVLVLNYGLYMERLRALGMSQGALADAVGVTDAHLSNVASGRKPNVSAALAFSIAGVLGVEVTDLFSLESADNAPRPKGAAAGARASLATVAA